MSSLGTKEKFVGNRTKVNSLLESRRSVWLGFKYRLSSAFQTWFEATGSACN
jgi:hypothetical protein